MVAVVVVLGELVAAVEVAPLTHRCDAQTYRCSDFVLSNILCFTVVAFVVVVAAAVVAVVVAVEVLASMWVFAHFLACLKLLFTLEAKSLVFTALLFEMFLVFSLDSRAQNVAVGKRLFVISLWCLQVLMESMSTTY